jgi:hypothetical protein
MKTLTLFTVIAGATLIGGCANRPYQSFQEYGSSTDFATAHAAKGARDDGSLYPRHFTGDALNSLGQTKLTLIATQAQGSLDRVNVFLVLSKEEATEMRQQAVAQFLAEYGVEGDRLALAVGPNPATADLAMLNADRVYTHKDGVMNTAGEPVSAEANAGTKAGAPTK